MVAMVTADLAESNGNLMTSVVTCRLTAKNRDQLGNQSYSLIICDIVIQSTAHHTMRFIVH